VELILESCVIVIVDEDTEGVNILEFTIFLGKSVFDIIHALSRSKDVLDGVVHWIVEERSEIVLIWRNVAWISVEALSHLENTSSLTILTPELALDLWDSVNSNSIELIGIDQVFNPVFKILSDVTIILVNIWKISKSAVFNFMSITPVVDLTI